MKRIALTILLLLGWIATAQANMVSIAGEMVNMRSGPGDHYEVLWELGKGYPLQVIAEQGDWLQVVDYEDDTGWVQRNQVADKAYMVVKIKAVNIRSGPGENYRIVRQALQGVVFRTVGTKGDWVKVRHEEEDVTGWMLRSLLWGW
ncbi:MAG: peptide-binding protein [Desulfurivibrio sp.]|jgi:SH3-like domain-containing protein|nr:MAG: peptide-binding protein [Desulfurivibrio sp.]